MLKRKTNKQTNARYAADQRGRSAKRKDDVMGRKRKEGERWTRGGNNNASIVDKAQLTEYCVFVSRLLSVEFVSHVPLSATLWLSLR
jgi:hypothetical protein